MVDIIHPGRANVSKSELQEKIGQVCHSHNSYFPYLVCVCDYRIWPFIYFRPQLFKVSEMNLIFLFGFRTVFGGGRSTGFALVYDDMESAKKFEPKHRLARVSWSATKM